MNVLCISNKSDFIPSAADFADIAHIEHATSGKEALSIITRKSCHLVIADENLDDMTGLAFIEKMISINPMINSAVASPLSPEEFHEVSEGLGVMMQLSLQPEKQEIQRLLEQVKAIIQLTENNT